MEQHPLGNIEYSVSAAVEARMKESLGSADGVSTETDTGSRLDVLKQKNWKKFVKPPIPRRTLRSNLTLLVRLLK